MKNLINNQFFQFKHICYLALILLMAGGTIACAAKGQFNKGEVTTDGLTVMKSTSLTEAQIRNGVSWSEYTEYQITPVDVSFRKDWKKDQNRFKSLSRRVTDEDMTRIRETVAKIVHKEFDRALQKKGGLTKADNADSNTLIFKPKVINLDVYAPEVQNAPPRSYIRQAGRATLFLEVHDAVSGEILARWVDTREDPDRGYFEWANKITNAERVRLVVSRWAGRLIEGLDNLKAVD